MPSSHTVAVRDPNYNWSHGRGRGSHDGSSNGVITELVPTVRPAPLQTSNPGNNDNEGDYRQRSYIKPVRCCGCCTCLIPRCRICSVNVALAAFTVGLVMCGVGATVAGFQWHEDFVRGICMAMVVAGFLMMFGACALFSYDRVMLKRSLRYADPTIYICDMRPRSFVQEDSGQFNPTELEKAHSEKLQREPPPTYDSLANQVAPLQHRKSLRELRRQNPSTVTVLPSTERSNQNAASLSRDTANGPIVSHKAVTSSSFSTTDNSKMGVSRNSQSETSALRQPTNEYRAHSSTRTDMIGEVPNGRNIGRRADSFSSDRQNQKPTSESQGTGFDLERKLEPGSKKNRTPGRDREEKHDSHDNKNIKHGRHNKNRRGSHQSEFKDGRPHNYKHGSHHGKENHSRAASGYEKETTSSGQGNHRKHVSTDV